MTPCILQACYWICRLYHRVKVRCAVRLQVYQLPSYSPDYNPIEHLWRNVKVATLSIRY
jgi:transposase